jgi:hypothetical protein
MAVTLNKTYFFTLDCGSKLHDLTANTLKLAFCTSAHAPTTASHIYTDLTVVALTNMATDPSLTSVVFTQSTGTATLGAATWTGTSQTGDFTFRYIAIYNDSATNKNIIGWYDYGSDLTLHGANGDQLTITFPSGILTNL